MLVVELCLLTISRLEEELIIKSSSNKFYSMNMMFIE